MTEQHPISLPPELVQQWMNGVYGIRVVSAPSQATIDIATRAAQWGADEELEACCEWLDLRGFAISTIDALRAARRPKPPPSLKQQGLDALSLLCEGPNPTAFVKCKDTILRALEALPDD